MPHQNTSSSNATAQNAATDPVAPRDQATDQDRKEEPRSYAASDVSDSSLAPPAAGEVSDYMDEGEALDGEAVQQGTQTVLTVLRLWIPRGPRPRPPTATSCRARTEWMAAPSGAAVSN